MQIENFERNARKALEDCLANVPFVKLSKRSAPKGIRPDAIFRVQLAKGQKKTIIVEFKKSGQPRLVRDVANQLARYKKFFPNAYGVIVAPYISPASAQICAKEGIGYVDFAGNCRLIFDSIYIDRHGNPNPFSERRDLKSLYSRKSSRIIRVLLSSPKRTWKLTELAAEARVSLGLVAKIKNLLLNREWIQETKDGLALAEPKQLLSQWADTYRIEQNRIFEFYALSNVLEIERQLSDFCKMSKLKFAFTGFSGAARVAPFVRYRQVTVYVEEDVEKVKTALDLKRVASGANVSMLIPYDSSVFYEVTEVKDIAIVSPIQLYLDLRNMPERGQEAAEFLLEEVINPRWS